MTNFFNAMPMRDWLAEGHLAWFVLEVVEQVDASAFHVGTLDHKQTVVQTAKDLA